MKEEIKKFLNGKDFILYRFYNNPDIILQSNEYDFNNKDFFKLLNLLLDDYEFINKLNKEIINKLLSLNLTVGLKEKVSFSEMIAVNLKERKKHEKDRILKSIEFDDYLKEKNYFLYNLDISKNYFSIVDNLFCNNDFLHISKEIIKKTNNYNILNNIYEIILESINVKENKVEYEWVYDRISKEKIDEFDLNEAKKVLNEIYRKLNTRKLKLVVNNKIDE